MKEDKRRIKMTTMISMKMRMKRKDMVVSLWDAKHNDKRKVGVSIRTELIRVCV